MFTRWFRKRFSYKQMLQFGSRKSASILFAATLFVGSFFNLRLLAGPEKTTTTKHPTVHEDNVMVLMRDGVKLATNITRPAAPGKYPAVLLRTPYNKEEEGKEIVDLAEFGYVIVAQDCRGRFSSQGEWVPFFHEAEDGDDAINWVATQPWSDGRVVTTGGSYSAMDQWLAATQHNPHLKGMISMVSPSDFYHGVIYQGGALNQGVLQMWSYFTSGPKLYPPESAPVAWGEVFSHIPVLDGVGLENVKVDFYRDWIAHPTDSSYWRRIRFDDRYGTFNLPVLHFTGWYDMFQAGTIENFRQMHDRAPRSVRDQQILIVGPWGHNSYGRKVGEIDFGQKANPDLIPLFVGWLDHVLNGGDDKFFAKPVRVFTMGENEWNDYDSWPVPGAQPIKFFLSSHGTSKGLQGSGMLSTASPDSQETPDHYVYDPANPVPTRGGGNCCWPKLVPWGPANQVDVEKRQDVLVYTSRELSHDLRITGPIIAKLWVSSSALDTDFTVKLVDVYPDGFAMNLADGILRARYRKSFESPPPLTPNKAYQITVEMGNTSNLFNIGHRIRVEVSSSNFPHFSRNTNTGREPETDSKTELARQTVLHDAKHLSYIVLSELP